MNKYFKNFQNDFKRGYKRHKQQLKSCIMESIYLYCRENFRLKEKAVLLQSRYGDDLAGNIFYILKELSQNYSDYTLYLSYKKKCAGYYKSLLQRYNIKNVHLVELHEFKYWYLLATCKYLVNDVTFHTAFLKREEQIYLNTWHGTPLKKMGLEEEQAGYLFGNTQRNFLAADYLLCPSRFMTRIMVRAYSLNHLFRGEILREGYPRNAIFFNESRRRELRKELNLDDCDVIAYLPTWRGNINVNKSKPYLERLRTYLDELDDKLHEKQFFFVKLHPVVSGKLDLSVYKHIRPMPHGYETYDFLNTVDCLVSDYSSVMFDFACSGRKIVLFTYDEEEFLQDRGLYISIKELPFKQVKDIDQLVKALNSDKTDYKNDAFIQGIVKHENKDAVGHICEKLLKDSETCAIQKLDDNDKPNVYFFVDGFQKNDITASVFSLINTIDLKKRNYFFVFRQDNVKANKGRIHDIPEEVGVLSLGSVEKTLPEFLAIYLYQKHNKKNRITNFYLNKCYSRMFEKYFGNVKKDYFYQFAGYGFEPLYIFKQAEKKIVAVHNDVKKEIEIRKVQHKNTLIDCYSTYDTVACVSIAAKESAEKIASYKGRYRIVHNCFDPKETVLRSELLPEFQIDTECITANINGLHGVLNSKGHKFITIGSFSKEKQHLMLLKAFNLYWAEHPDTQLIIIGDPGPLYAKALTYYKTLPCWKNVCIIKSIQNPMPILKQCDLFILSSNNEGIPVVFFEADCLHKPILSTDISGPREFLNKYQGGLLVDESAEALYQGMLAFNEGKIKLLNIDMIKYNKQCIREFEGLFE